MCYNPHHYLLTYLLICLLCHAYSIQFAASIVVIVLQLVEARPIHKTTAL